MEAFLSALGLVFVIEGALYTLFPDAMKRTTLHVSAAPARLLRGVGLGAAVIGFLIVWLARR